MFSAWFWWFVIDNSYLKFSDLVYGDLESGRWDLPCWFTSLYVPLFIKALSGQAKIDAKRVLDEINDLFREFLNKVFDKLGPWLTDQDKLYSLMQNAPYLQIIFGLGYATGEVYSYFDLEELRKKGFGKMFALNKKATNVLRARNMVYALKDAWLNCVWSGPCYGESGVFLLAEYLAGNKGTSKNLREDLGLVFHVFFKKAMREDLDWLSYVLNKPSILDKILAS